MYIYLQLQLRNSSPSLSYMYIIDNPPAYLQMTLIGHAALSEHQKRIPWLLME